MNKPKINPLFFIGLVGALTIGSHFTVQVYRAYWGNRDMWWTPPTMQLPIEDTDDCFELFISGKSLQNHLADEGLFALDNQGELYGVVSKDLGVRVNNWHEVRSSILTDALVSGVAFGVIATMLATGVVQMVREKKRRKMDSL